ncbi:MAG: lysine exporter LysO family protein [Clostridiales bacterium]|nr:lysine exporter LysO family protein [Clostridiales bacterium]
MKQLAMYWSAMVIMYIIASKLRNRKENFKWVGEAINVPIYVLVLLMGLRMGANKEIVDSLGTIGVQSVIVSVLVIGCSILGVILMRAVLKMDRYGNVGADRVPNGQKPEKAAEANVAGIRSTIIIGGLVAIGMAVGYFLIYKRYSVQDAFLEKSDPAITVLLIILLAFVGFSLGLDGSVFGNIKKAGARVFLFPLAIVAGTIVGGVIYGLISSLSIREGVAVAAGFGWYTYAPNIIAQAGYPVASAISFLHNVIREVVGIIGIPFFATKIGYIEATAVPGIAAMDVCMPIIEKYARKDTVVYGFATGLLMCILVPLIVPLMIGA